MKNYFYYLILLCFFISCIEIDQNNTDEDSDNIVIEENDETNVDEENKDEDTLSEEEHEFEVDVSNHNDLIEDADDDQDSTNQTSSGWTKITPSADSRII